MAEEGIDASYGPLRLKAQGPQVLLLVFWAAMMAMTAYFHADTVRHVYITRSLMEGHYQAVERHFQAIGSRQETVIEREAQLLQRLEQLERNQEIVKQWVYRSTQPFSSQGK